MFRAPFLYTINSTLYFTVFQQYTLLHRRHPPFIRQQSAVAEIAVLTTSGLHEGRTDVYALPVPA